jgi:hypothetical protein
MSRAMPRAMEVDEVGPGPSPTASDAPMHAEPLAAGQKSNYITTKAGLLTLMKTPKKHLPPLRAAVRKVSTIIQRGSLFLKLYLLQPRENDAQVVLNRTLVLNALKAVCKQPKRGPKTNNPQNAHSVQIADTPVFVRNARKVVCKQPQGGPKRKKPRTARNVQVADTPTRTRNARKAVCKQPKKGPKTNNPQNAHSVQVADTQGARNARETVCNQPNGDPKTPTLRDSLLAFYDKEFAHLLPKGAERPSYENLGGVLDYAATEIITSFENNVKANYVKYVDVLVAVECGKNKEIKRIRATMSQEDGKREIGKLLRKLRELREDLLNVDGADFKTEDHELIYGLKRTVLPAKGVYKKNSVYYDIHCNPLDYVMPMVRMMRRVEADNGKLLNAIPLNTSFVPRHITLDTSVLVRLFDDVAETLETTKTELSHKLQANKPAIWGVLFCLNKSIFHNSSNSRYMFDYMIKTDGVSCCVVQVRKDVAIAQKTKRMRMQEAAARRRAGVEQETKEAKGTKRKRGATCKQETKRKQGAGARKRKSDARELYVDELTESEKKRLQGRRAVGIDPGKSDLIYCCAEEGKLRFRYTQNQRRKEKKTKEYLENEQKVKKAKKVDGRLIAEWEAVLSAHNHKTVSFTSFKEYVRAKLLVSSKVEPFYAKHLFRKQRLYAYFNGRRSEKRMVDNFAAKFGPPEEVVIGFGNWNEGHTRKFMEPTKCKGLREAFRRRGYDVVLVDEFRTSVQCAFCKKEDGRCETFLRRKHPKAHTADSERECRARLVHGLLRCQSCSRLWNRDVNAAINITRLTCCALAGEPRPDYLARPSAARAATQTRTEAGPNWEFNNCTRREGGPDVG